MMVGPRCILVGEAPRRWMIANQQLRVPLNRAARAA